MACSAYATSTLPSPPRWHQQAACLPESSDPDLWFPDAEDRIGLRDAVAICLSCPVRQLCLDAAMAEEGSRSTRSRHGVRGGLTPAQRRGLYERCRAAAV